MYQQDLEDVAYRQKHQKTRIVISTKTNVRIPVEKEVLEEYGKKWIGKQISAYYYPKHFGIATSYELGKRMTGVWLTVEFHEPINNATQGRFFKNYWEDVPH